MNKKIEKPVVACYLCDFLREKSFKNLRALVAFSVGSVWRSKVAKKLLITGAIIALLGSIIFSVSKAGCLLVAYAIFVATIHHFWRSSVEHLSRQPKTKNADFDAKIKDVMNDIANLNLGGVELLLGFVGTLLWGFGPK